MPLSYTNWCTLATPSLRSRLRDPRTRLAIVSQPLVLPRHFVAARPSISLCSRPSSPRPAVGFRYPKMAQPGGPACNRRRGRRRCERLTATLDGFSTNHSPVLPFRPRLRPLRSPVAFHAHHVSSAVPVGSSSHHRRLENRRIQPVARASRAPATPFATCH
jgi:hypothetical protein